MAIFKSCNWTIVSCIARGREVDTISTQKGGSLVLLGRLQQHYQGV